MRSEAPNWICPLVHAECLKHLGVQTEASLCQPPCIPSTLLITVELQSGVPKLAHLSPTIPVDVGPPKPECRSPRNVLLEGYSLWVLKEHIGVTKQGL